ncbi:hypothetical protein DDZ14_05780 [Maritimibacter sp. 55A14]|uniref:YceI family protein n=1 Tax=Maritimibacter sp. 55A14 TaxID=2174844 RepID=UPI000D61F2AA|nr:YceI family protein [Maritimibacter sp. 55A14]PWE33294.1 hypothetical protein DDZ14_05780 [Maritimibacter sp. 55A14]
MRLRATILVLLCCWPLIAAAAPERYVLDAARSDVDFIYELDGDWVRGSIPIIDADLQLDFSAISRSRVSVRLDATRTRAGFILATQAVRGAGGLDAADYPVISFRSTSVRADGPNRARISGRVRMRGVERDMVLLARLYRQRGTEPGDLSRITLRLTGALNRSDFGSTAYSGLVGDRVGLDIMARVERQD